MEAMEGEAAMSFCKLTLNSQHSLMFDIAGNTRLGVGLTGRAITGMAKMERISL
jgi:hypothetical protein